MFAIDFTDPIYGEVHFTEPLLVDLYNSGAVQRLSNVFQGGITAFIKPERQTTRLDHSRGVAALLRRLGAGVYEQAAGLVHDVPHTALSHVIDFVFPNREHDYHEVHRDQVIEAGDLPEIVSDYGLDWRWLTDAEHFSLLEQPLPRLCADRLDYFLRDGVVDVGTFGKADAEALLSHLRPFQAHPTAAAQIVVDDVGAARWLGERFIELDDVCWCSVQEVGWYAAVAQALRAALAHGSISEDDFLGTDVDLMARLRTTGDDEVNRWLAYLRRDVDFARVDRSEASDATLEALPKVRTVDPPVLVAGEIIPLSRLDPQFAAQRQDYISSKQGPWVLKVLA